MAKRDSFVWTDGRIKRLADLAPDYNAAEIAELMGCRYERTVIYAATRYGIDLPKNNRGSGGNLTAAQASVLDALAAARGVDRGRMKEIIVQAVLDGGISFADNIVDDGVRVQVSP